MKFFNHISLGVLAAAFSLSSCSYYERFDTDPDQVKEELEKQGPHAAATTTFTQVKAKYMTSQYLLHDNAGHAKYAKTFTSYQIPAEDNQIINAVIVSTDLDGNTYKKLVLKDLADGSALDISVDVSGISADYPQGQTVTVDLSGLHIGLYADAPTVGLEYYNDDAKRTRWELGRISYQTTQEHIKAYGLPKKELIEPEVKTIPEIKALGTAGYSHLVKIKNVKFGYQTSQTASSPFFEPANTILYVNDTHAEVEFSFENSFNMPVARALTDQSGNVIQLSTSSYAKFAGYYMPEGIYDVTAIVGWYKDQAAKDGNYQLSLQRYVDIVKVSE